MIAALLISPTATVGAGLVAYGNIGNGPFASAGGLVISVANAEEHEGGHESGRIRAECGPGIAGNLHGALANITLGLVALHILGVGLASVVHRENLVGAMLSGKKAP